MLVDIIGKEIFVEQLVNLVEERAWLQIVSFLVY